MSESIVDELMQLSEVMREAQQAGDHQRALACWPEMEKRLQGDDLPDNFNGDLYSAYHLRLLGISLEALREFDEALKAYQAVSAFYDQPSLASKSEFDPYRALIASDIGVCLRLMGRLGEALESFLRAQALYDSLSLRDRPELDGNRAGLAMNMGNCLQQMGRLEEALASYLRAQALHDGPGLADRPELDGDRAMLAMNMGNCLQQMGRLEEALASYELAQALHDGPSLRDRLELDDERAKLAMNIGSCLPNLRRSSEALESHARAQALLDGPSLRDRLELDDERAKLAMNIGRCLTATGRLDEALVSYAQAQALYEGASLPGRTELDGERIKLAANMTGVMSVMEDAQEWARQASRALVTMVDLLPPVDAEPWAGMRRDFARFHRNWLSHCLDAGAFGVIPEVMAAIQGRDLAASVVEQLAQAETLDPDGPLASYLAKRLELRALLERMQGLGPGNGAPPDDGGRRAGPAAVTASSGLTGTAGAGGGSDSDTGTGAGDSSDPLAALHRAYDAGRRELPGLRAAAAAEPGFALLDAPQGAVTLASLQAALGPREQMLMLFPHQASTQASGAGSEASGDSASGSGIPLHGLLISGSGPVHHQSLPGLVVPMVQSMRFDLTQTIAARNGHDLRRNIAADGHVGLDHLRRLHGEAAGTDGDTAATPGSGQASAQQLLPLDAAEFERFWPEQAAGLRAGLWERFEDQLIEGGHLIVCTSGALHNLSLEPGCSTRPARISRLPGLAHLALLRGLYDRDGNTAVLPADEGAERALLASVLADESAHDIPLAGEEGRHVAGFWQASGHRVEHPSSYPQGHQLVDYLHTASHGTLRAGLGGMQSVIVRGRDSHIGEADIWGGPSVLEAYQGICVGGQLFDNPLDGNVSGVVSGFLRRGSHWVVASLLSLPDSWACLMGLIIGDLKATSGAPLDEVMARARVLYASGGWSPRVSEAWSEALTHGAGVGAAAEPSGDGSARQRPGLSLFRILEQELELLSHLPDADGVIANLEARAERHAGLWWLRGNAAGLVADYRAACAAPDDADRSDALAGSIRRAIAAGVAQACAAGTPALPERDTVLHGLTMFGLPRTLH